MKNYWSAESWGADYPPENWEKIVDEANRLIDAGADGDELWEQFCRTGRVGKVEGE